MQVFVPLLRSIAGAVPQSTSKIPHLRYHIALRRAQSQTSKHNGPPLVSVQQQRHNTTSTSVPYFDFPPEILRAKEETRQAQEIRSAVADEELTDNAASAVENGISIRRVSNMYDILAEGHPDQILSGLISKSIGEPFIQHADGEMFNKALLALDPNYFVSPFKDVSRHLKGHHFEDLIKPSKIDNRLWKFAAYLDEIIYIRREAGNKLDQEACAHLLHWAATMGDTQIAKSVINIIMPADGVKPDLESYNHYCRALLWGHAFSSGENYRLRVIKPHLEIRASRNPPESLSGHANASSLQGVTGIKEQILKTFQECIDQGYVANETMFNNLMLAMSREGDLDGVKSILRSVWNIDVNLLQTYDEEEVESPTFYEVGNPLRPSEDLLFTVAHVFGSNNDMRTCWLLVDFISRNYDLRITERVWMHLCEWAFVLSLRRSNSGRLQHQDTGQISQQTLVRLIATMTDEPHNIKPNAFIHHILARSWRDQKHLNLTVHHVKKLRNFVDQHYEGIKRVQAEVMRYIETSITSSKVNAFATDEFYKLRRRFILEYLEFERNSQFLKAAVRNLLTTSDWAGSGKLTEWTRRRLWNILDQFRSYLPNQVVYQTRTGTVEFLTKYKQRGELYRQHKLDDRTLPRILRGLDHEDYSLLYPNMQALLATIVLAKQVCLNCGETDHSHQNCRRNDSRPSTLDYRWESSGANITPKGDMFVYHPQWETMEAEPDPEETLPSTNVSHST